ncbi:hypothetical protein WJ56_06460 [Burkholderia ubonensis]|nr:hypothetical protein WJ56_06460 [Burkholderia ubonensis]
MLEHMHIVRQRQSGAASSSVAQISSDPNCIDGFLDCATQHRRKCHRTTMRGVTPVMHRATIRIGVETVFEL